MAYVNVDFTQRIPVRGGIVERDVQFGIERDSRISVLDVGLSLPEQRGGRIPAESRQRSLDPTEPRLQGAIGAIRDAVTGGGMVEKLTVEVQPSGPDVYTWTRRRSHDVQTSTTPPAHVIALADAMRALHEISI